MPQLAYTLDCPPDPFGVQRVSATTEKVYAAAAITVTWHGASPSVILAGTIAGPGAVDTGADLYLIVAEVGSAALTLVMLADALTTGIDVLLPGATWGIIGEVDAQGVHLHQQTAGGTAGSGTGSGVVTDPGGGITIPPNSPGGILWFNPITHRLELLTPRKGDILRGNLSGGIPIWELYNVSQGAQDQVLTNDLGNTGLPIWSASTGQGAGVVSDSAHGLYLDLAAVDSGAETFGVMKPMIGTPPANWQTIAFDDSTWATSINYNDNSGTNPYIPGTQFIWGATRTEWHEVLIRFKITMTGMATGTLHVAVDDMYLLYFNGVQIGAQQVITENPAVQTYNITLQAGVNVLAFWGKNDKDNGGGVCYKLTFP